jgi:trans-2,3-dihydro-3-hydroxyanthranilate isomerase
MRKAMTMQFYILDVFAEEKYAGNQLAVFRGAPSDAMMQRLAQEMHYSETTFITNESPVNGGYDTRIFTPAIELPFAGHPTLGTAYVVRHEIIGKAVKQVILNEKVGQIPVDFADDGVLWMTQKQPQFGHIYAVEEVAAALGLAPDDIDERYPVQEVSTGTPFIITPIKTMEAVKRAEVNLPKYKQMIVAGEKALAARGIMIVCHQAELPQNDFHSRVFVHLNGIPEDPAAGSANGNFAGWLAKYRYLGHHKVDARVEQGFEIHRPSLLLLDAEDKGSSISVKVGGRVQLVAKGELVD